MAIVNERETDGATQEREPGRTDHIDARRAFVAVRLAGGGVAVVCVECGASMRLHLGRNRADAMKHADDCRLGASIAALAARKPTWLQARGN